eukprot:9129823-Pyramimonas_sp.AAC.1
MRNAKRTSRQADSAAANAGDATPGETPRSQESSKGREEKMGVHRDRIWLARQRLLVREEHAEPSVTIA